MYFWKISKLKSDLINQPLPESESFKYLIANAVVYGLAMIPFGEKNIWDIYFSIATLVITILGTIYIYGCNRGANGKNFLQRYVSLSWVVGIRWIVLIALPIIILYYIAIGIYFGIVSYTINPLDIILFSILLVSYFWLLGKHMKEVAK